VKAHAAELKNVQAVLIDDMGSGRIKGFPDMGVEAVRAHLAAALVPVNSLGATEIPAAIMPGATDHWPFHQAGVPAFAATQDALDYHTHTHHSQVDTLDHVAKEDLIQGAQVLAATAWGLLNGARLPHHEPVKGR
jgi:Zn-dependent M28 family amino/carboxypeptidase